MIEHGLVQAAELARDLAVSDLRLKLPHLLVIVFCRLLCFDRFEVELVFNAIAILLIFEVLIDTTLLSLHEF